MNVPYQSRELASQPDSDIRYRIATFVLMTYFSFFFLSLIVIYVRGFFWGQEFPLNTFLPYPEARFGDYFGSHDYWYRLQFDTVGYQGAYFPFTYLLIDLFVSYLAAPYASLSAYFLSLLIIGGLFLAKLSRISSAPRSVTLSAGLLLIASYPALITFHTGNVEGWTFLFILGAIIFRLDGQSRKAVVLLSLATAMKVLPIVFLPCLLIGFDLRRRRSLTALFVISGITATLIALVTQRNGLLEGWGVIDRLRQSQEMYKSLMVTGQPGTYFGHSALNGLHALFGQDFLPSADYWLVPLVLLALLITALCIVRLEAEFWSFVLFCGASGCLLAPTSTDYKLLYLMPGLLIRLLSTRTVTSRHYLILGVALVAIAPKPWGVLGSDPYLNAGVWLTPIVLMALLVLCSSKWQLTPRRTR